MFYKKFLNQEVFRDEPENRRSKVNYFLHQFLIWGIIFLIACFIIKFYNLNV